MLVLVGYPRFPPPATAETAALISALGRASFGPDPFGLRDPAISAKNRRMKPNNDARPHSSGDGLLVVNLGTPAAPTASAVRRYLAEFLGDPRVVELPRLLWYPVLYGVILPLRRMRSAAAYRRVWTDQGSPLLVESQQ